MSFFRRLGERLASPRGRWLAPIAAVVLTVSSLGNGLAFDDALQRLKAHGAYGPSLAQRLDLFTFVPGTPEGNARLLESGFLPWFASRDLRLAFFRPLSALWAFFDYTWLDRARWVMHAENVALYAIVVALAVVAYRRFLAPPIAALAALLYAIDDGHGMVVGWLASRNAMLATAFSLATLIAHDRWRRDRARGAVWLAASFFALAVASAELAIGGLAYLAAYAVTIEPERRWTKRAASLAPYVAVVVPWQLVYRALGYGARGSGLYVDPIATPLAFARAFPERGATLLLAQIGTPPADLASLAPPGARLAIALVAVLVIALVAWAIAPRVARDPAARFFALGAVLAVVPVTATVASDRLLMLVGIGAFGVVASVIGDLREVPAPATNGRERAARVVRGAWIVLHLVLAPIALPVSSLFWRAAAEYVEHAAAGVHVGPEIADQTLVLVNAPNVLVAYPLLFPTDDAHPAPRRMRGFASGTTPVTLHRDDARTVTVRIDEDRIDPIVFLFRGYDAPLLPGQRYDIPGCAITVGEGGATTYRFDRSLDDPSFRVVAWRGNTFVDYVLPPPGGTATVGAR